MALPAFPLFSAIGAGIVAGLTQFFVSKAGFILAGLGLTFIGVKSFEAFLGYVITDITFISNQLSGIHVGFGSGATVPVLQIMAHIGVFDFVNIVVSGYMAAGSILGMKVVLGRLSAVK